MERQLQLLGRDLKVTLTASALRALEARAVPLHVEMELYFSCLIKKRLRFDVPQRGEAVWIGQALSLSFRPVMGRVCGLDEHDPDDLADLPTGEPQRFVPRWLKLDHRRGQWRGEFGY